jgi:hypothetical protein
MRDIGTDQDHLADDTDGLFGQAHFAAQEIDWFEEDDDCPVNDVGLSDS